jgi:hypothetical protein
VETAFLLSLSRPDSFKGKRKAQECLLARKDEKQQKERIYAMMLAG